ncbi:hypothetical protein A21D_02783 [Virgibacillus dokdonensis]|uniref:Uncharacterized protein n=1 Tax=Virgibacillus dokdonensis TaxID=302167 RepID=A0A2K9J1M4_9BACI|nr:hypothetical protein A21D_02783 [Virgibacillus dokdonensis]
MAGEAIFEIGRRLKHVKEKDLVHGEWNTWCQNKLGFTRQYANRFVKIYEELGSNGNSGFHSLSAKALYQIATLPPEQRESEHTTSKGEQKTPSEMTVRELRQLKADLKKAEERAEVERKERERLEQLDDSTATFLRKKESNMREIVGKAYTELGRELKEAQDELSRRGSKYEGVFERWYTSIGFKRQKVYDLINRYNLLRISEEVSDVIEDLPVSLTYEIAKPSADSTPAKTHLPFDVEHFGA